MSSAKVSAEATLSLRRGGLAPVLGRTSSMWRSIIIALALICLGLLGWYAVRKYPYRIEADIEARAQKVLNLKVPGVLVDVPEQTRTAVLAGAVPTEADRAMAEKLVSEISGVKNVTNQITIGTQPVPVPPAPATEAIFQASLDWTGTNLTLSGSIPNALVEGVSDKVRATYAAASFERKYETTEGASPARASAVMNAALEALALTNEGKAEVGTKRFTLTATVADAATEAKVRSIVDGIGGGELTLTIPSLGVEAADVAEATAEVVDVAEPQAEVIAEVAPEVVDAGPVEVAVAPEVVQPVAPGGALTPAQCKTTIQALIEGDKRITFKSNTGKLTDEGEAKVKEIAAILARCPTAKGTIEGYHDDFGDPDKVKELTQIRAYNVHKRLTDLGMDKTRFRYIGLGYRNMRYGGKPGMRVLNQRVEFNITVE